MFYGLFVYTMAPGVALICTMKDMGCQGLLCPGPFAGLLCWLSFAGHIWLVPHGAWGIRGLPDAGMPPRRQISQSIDFGSGTPSFLSSFA